MGDDARGNSRAGDHVSFRPPEEQIEGRQERPAAPHSRRRRQAGKGLRRRARSRHRDRRRRQLRPRSWQPAAEHLHAGLSRRTGARARQKPTSSKCQVLERKDMEKLGMGSLLSVAQRQPPAAEAHQSSSTAAGRKSRSRWCWSARASRSTPAASRSSPPPKWTR